MPLSLALWVTLGLAACTMGSQTTDMRSPDTSASPTDTTMTLFDFTSTDGSDWRIQNDGVMGGRSKGYAEISNETLRFTGTVIMRGGGFTSVIARRDVDLSGFDGVEMRVRGGGRTFEVDFFDGTQDRGRDISRRGAFPTTEDWQTVQVAFDDLRTSVHGEPIQVEPLDRAAIQSIGLYIIDGQDGPFELEVDWIRAYRTDA
ncbi:MAG: hypothetical protein Rubg2KO_02600 [Rubricoccaceae bacterium]